MNLLHRLPERAPLEWPAGPAGGARRESIFSPRVARAISIGLVLIVLFNVARAAPTLTEPSLAIAWLAAVTFACAFPFGMERHQAIAASLCGLSGVTIHAISAADPGATGLLMVIIALVQASRAGASLGPTLALITGGGYEAVSIGTAGTFDAAGLLSSASGFVFAYLAASNYRRLREEKRTTERLLAEVLAGRDAQIRAATLDERARIAREIHDILAHTLSALAVQLEGTRLLVEQRPGDPAAVVALARASGLARDGLEETTRAVSALRGDALPGPDELPHLAATFERDTAIPCRFVQEGAPIAISPEACVALYRTAQEALTNVRKHTVAASVAISLRYGVDTAELTVENVGRTRTSSLPGSGNGLNGMRERAVLARGRLEAGPTPTGFRVYLWLPA